MRSVKQQDDELRKTKGPYIDFDNKYIVCYQYAHIQISVTFPCATRGAYHHADGICLPVVLVNFIIYQTGKGNDKRPGAAFYLRHVRGRLLAAVILKEPITKMKALGVLMGCIGGISLILASTHATGQASSLEGNLMIIVSAFVYSIYLVLSKPLSLRYSAVTMMKWMFLFSTLVLLPFTYRHVLDTPAFQRETLNMQELGAISFVLIGATFIPYLLIPMSLKRIRPTTVSMYNYIQPIIASLIAVMIGQDTFSLQKVLSAVLVFTGVYLVTQSKSRADLEKESR